MGDPETEVVIPRIENDLVPVFQLLSAGRLNEVSLQFLPETAVTTMLVSQGYPGDYQTGFSITGAEQTDLENCIVFHAGTKSMNNEVLTAGGRVIAVTAFGSSVKEAGDKSRDRINGIHYQGKTFRNDIGYEFS
jgi:phosphoribosylamine--glycine ligase